MLSAGSVEWMRAGHGVWHTGAPEPEGVRGFQLWVALPPELENAPNASHYVMPEESPVPSEASIDFLAEGDAVFVLGSAPAHRHPLALGSYSVHTSPKALRQGEAEIRRIGARLLTEGKRSYALRAYGDPRAGHALPPTGG